MKHRSPIGVLLLSIVTLGIYGIVWIVLTAREMRTKGAQIPNAILIIIPIINLYWLWKYCEGIEKVSDGKYSAVLMFVLFWFIGFIGIIVAQSAFNEAASGTPVAPADGSITQPLQTPAPTSDTSVAPSAAPIPADSSQVPAQPTNAPFTPAAPVDTPPSSDSSV